MPQVENTDEGQIERHGQQVLVGGHRDGTVLVDQPRQINAVAAGRCKCQEQPQQSAHVEYYVAVGPEGHNCDADDGYHRAGQQLPRQFLAFHEVHRHGDDNRNQCDDDRGERGGGVGQSELLTDKVEKGFAQRQEQELLPITLADFLELAHYLEHRHEDGGGNQQAEKDDGEYGKSSVEQLLGPYETAAPEEHGKGYREIAGEGVILF